MCTKKQTVCTRRREHHGISVFSLPPAHPARAALSSSSSSQVVEPRRQAVGGGVGSNRPAACLYTAPAAFALDISSRLYIIRLWKQAGRKGHWVGRGHASGMHVMAEVCAAADVQLLIVAADNPFPVQNYATLAEQNDKAVSAAVVCKSAARGGDYALITRPLALFARVLQRGYHNSTKLRLYNILLLCVYSIVYTPPPPPS